MAYAGASNGHDQEGTRFLHIARKMAERLGLDDDTMDPPQRSCTLETTPISDDLRFRSHIAWGYFIIVK
jgi:hypothetical protein